MKNVIIALFVSCLAIGCSSQKSSGSAEGTGVTLAVNASYFSNANPNIEVTTVSCTLSDGTETKCYQIITNSTPVDHAMGPWCPDNISDDASAGGIWLEGGKVYDVDGTFIENLASFYQDNTWQMYDAEGNVYVTKTEQECIEAANPNVGDEYKNFCVECLPSYISEVSRTYLIPINPVLQNEPLLFGGPGGPQGPEKGDRGERPDGPPPGGAPSKRPGRPERGENNMPSTRGIALNGVEYSAPAPVNNILAAYTLAPFDDAGGHINVHQGYHYHTATGMSYAVKQSDGHAPLIGYAMDGHGIYSQLDDDGNSPTDLDDCRGHYDDVRGYHYHVDAAGNNNFINCLHGAYAKN